MEKSIFIKTLAVTAILGLAACSGDDGKDGSNGSNGAPGSNGVNSLVKFTDLPAGDAMCFKGGVMIEGGLDSDGDGVLATAEITETSYNCAAATLNTSSNFNRVASFPVCSQLDSSCDTDTQTSAEIAAVSSDGMTLVYTDSPMNALGFVDISNPAMPAAGGTIALSGEPTSVAVKGEYALVGVNTSENYVDVAGDLVVVNIATQTVVTTLDLGGQPDSVAVSPDGNYAAVVLENERNELLCVSGTYAGTAYDDEDLAEEQCEDEGNGELGLPPQAPAGALVVVNISDAAPANWSTSTVDLSGFDGLYPTDPEPEYVDINANNIAVVTLQENNHLFLVDLTDGSIVNNFTAGTVDLEMIDTEEEDPAIISLTDSEDGVLREPDGVSWINNEYFATANEGDLDGGSRGFSVYNTSGEVVWDSGSMLEHLTVKLGQYPDGRSGNKGNEPENIEMGIYGGDRYLFVNSERSSLVFVFDVADPTKPVYKQTLPAGVAPEGGLAIPSRNLLVVASEEDARDDKIRSVVNIYQYNTLPASYPTLQSVNRFDGTPIPWSAMSGLSSDPWNDSVLYSIEDSFYGSNRIFTIDASQSPALLVAETTIMDSNNVFAGVTTSGATEDPASFDAVDLAAMINSDKSVNIDPEGIARASDGGFWVASEGAGTMSDTEGRPIQSLNFLFKTDAYGVIEDVVSLPSEVNALQVRFGFEGVAEYLGKLYVAIQRAWEGEANPRIGIYDIVSETWEFVYYPLDARESQNKGWVGLSDISAMGNGEFLIVERDNQGGPDAAIKRLYKINLASYTPGATIVKTPVRDLMLAGDLTASGGLTPEKIEGSAVMANGDVFIINDNDGVDDNSGETRLINLGNILN
ncbi:hypothetical protein P886_4074 [Alteromonadaceae bacterium 2753L.S.0a.02]|nr:hypothetical protein P886_4074 [Alteromonadaceae bacterium 2753L.S.0a.02]